MNRKRRSDKKVVSIHSQQPRLPEEEKESPKQKRVMLAIDQPQIAMLDAKIEGLYERVLQMEEEMGKALDALSQGIANNVEQLWDNQKELAGAMAEMSDDFMAAIGETDNEKAESTRSRLQPQD